MKKILAIILCLSFFCSAIFSSSTDAEKEILKILTVQADQWNRGSFEGFMATYWKSDKLTFQSANNRVLGWQALLNRYRTNYGGKKRGTLSFKDLEVRIFNDALAMVLGRYHLITDSGTSEGLFTLIMKKFPRGWKIIHDHSSSDS